MPLDDRPERVAALRRVKWLRVADEWEVERAQV
jgi:hypothetical protein